MKLKDDNVKDKIEEISDDISDIKKESKSEGFFYKTGAAINLIKIILLLAAIAIVAFIVLKITGIFGSDKNQEQRLTTITKSSLTKVLEISNLSTLDFIYNGITDVKNDEGELKYHVAYEGTVTAGIDFKKIKIDLDDKNKKITVTIPETYIQDCDVSMPSLKFIFEDDDYNTETVTEEAYKACIKDLEEKSAKENDLLELAGENAKKTVEGLIDPWVKQIDGEYKVDIKQESVKNK